jgi:hypothetical protein
LLHFFLPANFVVLIRVAHGFGFETLEVGKLTLKSNGNEALSNESLKKSYGNEALNDDFS